MKWSTSEKTIVTVSQKGKVTGKNAGTAIVTATAGKQSLRCKVTVKATLNKTKVTIAKNDSIKLSLNGAAVKKFNSSNKNIAAVSKNGKVVGKHKGKATITVVDTNGKKYTCKITVENPSLNEKAVTLQINQNYKLKLNGNTQKVSWSSSNESVAHVDSEGRVIAYSEGNTVITAKVGSKSFKCKVTVKSEEVPEATPIPEATPTPEPTATPIPEPEPTATPIPGPTATPIPTPTEEPVPSLPETEYPTVDDLDTDDVDVEIYSFAASVRTIPVNQSETVTFTAEIFANIELGSEDVQVVDGNNDLTGYMSDAGDGIYSLTVDLSSSSEVDVNYYARVQNVISSNAKIGFYKPITDEEEQEMQIVDKQISSCISEDMSEEEKKKAIESVLNKLTEENLIISGSVSYDEENGLYSFQYKSGIEGGISLKKFGDDVNTNSEFSTGMDDSISELDSDDESEFSDENSTGTDSAKEKDSVTVSDNFDDGSSNDGRKSDELFQDDFSTASAGDTAVNNYSALVLNGFENTSFRRNFYNSLDAEWDEKGLETTVDTNVTVGSLKTFADYNIIVLAMHGSMYGNDPVICINETVTDDTDKRYAYEIKTKRSVKKVLCTDGTYHYWITSEFFTDSYNSNDLNGKLIFSETCMFYGCDCKNTTPDKKLANALTEIGTEVVVGYHNSVNAEYSRNVMKYVIEQTYDGVEVNDAVNNARQKYGNDDNREDVNDDKYKAYPLVAGNGRYSLRHSNSTVSGHIVDAESNIAISNALIRIYKDGKNLGETRTDSNGNYAFSALLPGKYLIKL